MTQFPSILAINIYSSMARQSEKESAEKYALESLKKILCVIERNGGKGCRT